MPIFNTRVKPANTLIAATTASLLLLSQASCSTGSYNEAAAPARGQAETRIGFEGIDNNQDGLLTWSEINQPLDDQLADAGWGKDEVFERYDDNNDDFLDSQEFTAFASALSREVASIGDAASKPNKGWFAFDDVDADNDGRVGIEEFGDAGISEDFSVFDDNGDGGVDEQEFETFTEQLGISNFDNP